MACIRTYTCERCDSSGRPIDGGLLTSHPTFNHMRTMRFTSIEVINMYIGRKTLWRWIWSNKCNPGMVLNCTRCFGYRSHATCKSLIRLQLYRYHNPPQSFVHHYIRCRLLRVHTYSAQPVQMITYALELQEGRTRQLNTPRAPSPYFDASQQKKIIEHTTQSRYTRFL